MHNEYIDFLQQNLKKNWYTFLSEANLNDIITFKKNHKIM